MKFFVSALILVSISVFVINVTPHAAYADCNVQRTCDDVLKKAKKLPSPNPSSIYNYGKKNVQNIEKCLNCASENIFGTNNSNNTNSQQRTGRATTAR